MEGKLSATYERQPPSDDVLLQQAQLMLGVDDVQVSVLREHVAHNNGRLVMLVHPYYDTNLDESSPFRARFDDELAAIAKMQQRAHAVLNISKDTRPPVFILEATKHIPALIERIGEDHMDRGIYIVPTEEEGPLPDFPWVRSDGDTNSCANVAQVHDVLSYLGVTDVLLGGMYLWHFADGLGSSKLQSSDGGYDGCVGLVRKWLEEDGFSTSVSPFTYPISRIDFTRFKDAES